MTAIRRLFRNSGLLFVLAFGLLALPACDSGGSNGGGGGGGGENTFGPSDPSGANAFELSFSSSSSASSASKAGLAKATTTYKGYSFQFQGSTNGNDYYAIFFTSNSSFTSSNATDAAVFGALVAERTSKPSPGDYAVGEVNSTTAEFYGLIGQNFDSGPNKSRTIQLLSDGKITIGRSSGNLVVSDFKNVTAQQITVDLSGGTVQSSSFTENVSVTLNGSIQPSPTGTFAQPSFGFSIGTGTGGGGGGGGEDTAEDVVTTTDALDGNLKIKIQGTDQVNYTIDETTDGSLVGTGGVASGPESGFSEEIPTPDDLGGSGFDTYELTAEETKQADVSFTLTLLEDGSGVASVTEPADDGNGSATIEVQAP